MIITIVLICFVVLIAGTLIGRYLEKRNKQFTDEELIQINESLGETISQLKNEGATSRVFQKLGDTSIKHSISAEDFRKLYQKHYGVVIMAHTNWCDSWSKNNKGNCKESNCPNHDDCKKYVESIGIYSATGHIDFLNKE